jgi:hypothetical protein
MAVRCQGELYPLDLALTQGSAPFGELLKAEDLNTSPILKSLLWGVIMSKAVPSLKDRFMSFLENEKNETDFSQPLIWQGNDLPFPTLNIPLEQLPGLASDCLDSVSSARTMTATVYEVVRITKRGKLTVFEYDRHLLNELSQSPLRESFLYMSVFLEPYAKDSVSRAMMNSLLHAQRTIYRDDRELRQLVNQYLRLPSNGSICGRSGLVVEELQRQLARPCEEIKTEELALVENLVLEGNGDETLPFSEDDLVGLSSLQSLTISSTAGLIDWFNSTNLRDLGTLKTLRLNGNDFVETPKNFMEGPYKLTSLDLSANAIFELKENAFRQVFVSEAPVDQVISLDLSRNGASWSPRRNAYINAGAFSGC